MDYHEITIEIPDSFRDVLSHKLFGAGALGTEERAADVTAYFPGTADLGNITRELDIVKALLEKAGYTLSYRASRIPLADWNENWKKGFTPIDADGTFTIIPPWELEKEGRTNLIIDPGMAFGTGHHETTRSCLALMEHCRAAVRHERFLDLGSGTGILAIAAAKLGFKYILALDTDPLAVEAVKKNAELNYLADIHVQDGDITGAEGTFDLIAANLFSGILMEIAPKIASRLKPQGITIISGFFEDQAEEVFTSFRKAGLALLEQKIDGLWISAAFKNTS